MFGPNYLVLHAEGVKALLTSGATTRHPLYTKEGTRLFEVTGRVYRQGLFTTEGDAHLLCRKRMQPAFHPEALDAYEVGIVRACARRLDEWKDLPEEHRMRNIKQEMRTLALDIVAETIFGSDLRNSMDAYAQRFFEAEQWMLEVLSSPMVLPEWFPTRGNRGLKVCARELDAIAASVVARRRQVLPQGQDTLLGQILGTEAGREMTDEQLRDEVETLIVGAVETTAAALSWALYLLFLPDHQGVQTRLYEEVDTLLSGRVPGAGDLKKLSLTRMVVSETLRLYPPVWGISRKARETHQLGGALLPKGTEMIVCPYLLHRQPEYWERPDEFDPDRFSSPPLKYTYLPFGAGTHKCIGEDFALRVGIYWLALLAQRYRFDPPSSPVGETVRAFHEPGELHMHLRHR